MPPLSPPMAVYLIVLVPPPSFVSSFTPLWPEPVTFGADDEGRSAAVAGGKGRGLKPSQVEMRLLP